MATGTLTPNLHLFKPTVGSRGWGALVNGNFDTLDQLVAVVGGYGHRGLVGVKDAVTPNSKYVFSADLVILRNPVNKTLAVVSPVAPITLNTLTTGANGLDTGVPVINTWYHFYFIWNPTTSTIATLGSLLAPPTGPGLPTGYTHWAYAGAIFMDGAPRLVPTLMRGSWMIYESPPVALSGGAATVATAVSVANFVPPNGLQYELCDLVSQLQGTAAAGIAMRLNIEIVSGTLAFPSEITLPTLTGVVHWSFGTRLMPNVGQQFFYLWTVTTGTGPSANLGVSRYSVGNGGE